MKRFIVGFIPLSFMVGLPAIAGRMACVLTAALLLCASSAHGQVIEEGGFPVKGGGVSGEPFSLSCPPRLYVEAGESVLFSCSATAVPEEGVRYEWESLSGDGLHLLSASDELARRCSRLPCQEKARNTCTALRLCLWACTRRRR